jgi:hypothetical protein
VFVEIKDSLCLNVVGDVLVVISGLDHPSDVDRPEIVDLFCSVEELV